MGALRRRDDVNWIEIDGDVVAVDTVAEEVFVLRGAAATLWQVIDGAPLDGLDALVAQALGLDVDEAGRRLAEAVATLTGSKLVEDVDQPA